MPRLRPGAQMGSGWLPVPALFIALVALPHAAPAPKSVTVPARPTVTAVAVAPVSPSASVLPNGPCRDLLLTLPIGKTDPAPYLEAAACLRRRDSVAAGFRMPFELSLRARDRAADATDSLLRARLPADRGWLITHLDRIRLKRDAGRSLDMAWLAEASLVAGIGNARAADGPTDVDVFRELAAVYLTLPDPYHAALSLLRQAELDSTQASYVQYQLENALRTAGTEGTPTGLLDSLTAAYAHRTARTAEILEGLCWGNRDYPGAYRNLLTMLALKGATPSVALERVSRFQSLGYFDYCSAILEKMQWRKLPQPWLGLARSASMQIRYQLQDWPGLIAEASAGAPSDSAARVTGTVRPPGFSPEESFFIATALLKLGKPQDALVRIRELETKAEPPWGFRGRLLKAQAQMALGKPGDAGQTLDGLKHDPNRQEATGPILFWQSCLALDQGRYAAAESLLVLASAYTGSEESQRALDYRFFLLLDTVAAVRPLFFRGLPEAPRSSAERRKTLEKVPAGGPLWPYAQLEKAQILLQEGEPDSAAAVFDRVAKQSPDRLAAFQADAKAAFIEEKLPGGRQVALARYEDLLIKYQQGVIPEFSRGRIKALR